MHMLKKHYTYRVLLYDAVSCFGWKQTAAKINIPYLKFDLLYEYENAGMGNARGNIYFEIRRQLHMPEELMYTTTRVTRYHD